MKNVLKNLSKLLLVVFACLFFVGQVDAEEAKSKMKITSYVQSSTPISFPATFRVKKDASGKYAYCTHYAMKTPSEGVTYTKGSKITDNGMNYILNKAYSSSNDNSFFIYQTALWVYMVDKGMMQGPYYDLTVFKSNINGSNSETANKIKTLVSEAKKASKNDTSAPTISVNAKNVKFALGSGKKYYVSDSIKVNSSTGKYAVEFTNAPSGTKVIKDGNSFVVKVPVGSVSKLSTKVAFKVYNSKTIYTSYYYNPSNSSYQVMTSTVKNSKSASEKVSLTLTTTSSLEVVKVDSATGEAIKGASMQIVNSNGKVVDSFVSTTTSHKVSGLSQGTYTLKEIAAPSGYKLSGVETKFTVLANGKIQDSSGKEITKLTYKNDKTEVTISKQDITSKAELPGATLVIKDSSGKEIIKWVSSDKKYVIKGLAAGTYTLTETIAPDGYVLSTEAIKFRVDNKGILYNGNGTKVDSIVMYNTKDTDSGNVSISKRDITSNAELEGATLVLKNESGEEIDSWVSEKSDHVVSDLKEGTYTLTETIAPEGYILSEETVTFKIDSEGNLLDKDGNKIEKVIMYNQKSTTPGGVSISKQDITTKTELPGATLELKDYDGNLIETWVSSDTPHIIDSLNPGIYTLTETIAPDGYILSDETITFTVKDDGSIVKVVMYNSPDSKDTPDVPSGNGEDVVVENTSSFKTITSSVIGGVVILASGWFLAKNLRKKKGN